MPPSERPFMGATPYSDETGLNRDIRPASDYQRQLDESARQNDPTFPRPSMAQEIANLRSGSLKYESNETRERKIHVYGDTAVVLPSLQTSVAAQNCLALTSHRITLEFDELVKVCFQGFACAVICHLTARAFISRSIALVKVNRNPVLCRDLPIGAVGNTSAPTNGHAGPGIRGSVGQHHRSCRLHPDMDRCHPRGACEGCSAHGLSVMRV